MLLRILIIYGDGLMNYHFNFRRSLPSWHCHHFNHCAISSFPDSVVCLRLLFPSFVVRSASHQGKDFSSWFDVFAYTSFLLNLHILLPVPVGLFFPSFCPICVRFFLDPHELPVLMILSFIFTVPSFSLAMAKSRAEIHSSIYSYVKWRTPGELKWIIHSWFLTKRSFSEWQTPNKKRKEIRNSCLQGQHTRLYCDDRKLMITRESFI